MKQLVAVWIVLLMCMLLLFGGLWKVSKPTIVAPGQLSSVQTNKVIPAKAVNK